jgi:hypothetical protein
MSATLKLRFLLEAGYFQGAHQELLDAGQQEEFLGRVVEFWSGRSSL